MKKIKEFIVKKIKMVNVMENFALAFAGGSVHRFCFYIFHQPKMPDELMKLNEK
ncbi:MAG: cyclic lactone autoinducer peptide [Eubacterium sp.]